MIFISDKAEVREGGLHLYKSGLPYTKRQNHADIPIQPQTTLDQLFNILPVVKLTARRKEAECMLSYSLGEKRKY